MTESNSIFVFGSNLAGRHGKGAALEAIQKHGAIYGQGFGRQGNSWAIPTKNQHLKTLSLNEINAYVSCFVRYANWNTNLIFNITRVGCGLAGYTDAEIAPFFKDAPENCNLPKGWRKLNQCLTQL